MRKVFIVFFLFVICCLLVGCNLNSNMDLYVNFKINYSKNIDASTRLAVCEIEDRITGIVLMDCDSLTKDKINDLCKSILDKWESKEEVRVALTDLKNFEITIGTNDNNEVVSKNIMLPI